MKEFLSHCIAACNRKEWRKAEDHDLRVISVKIGIVGMVDRIFSDRSFSIIRAGGSLPFGISGAERLRIAAYALCLEEMTGEAVNGGFVEYIPDGIARYHEVQPRDRRSLLSHLKNAREIRSGSVPERPLNAPCGRCGYRETCETMGGHRLSEIL